MYGIIQDVKNEKKEGETVENLLSIPELFDHIISYLDCESIINLLLTSPHFYLRYAYNPYTVNKLITQILKELNIKLPIMQIYNELEYKDQRLIFNDIISICLYFINLEKYSFGLGDIIIFLVDRNKRYSTSLILFEQLLIQMNKTASNPRIRRIHGLDCNQVSTLITNCDSQQLQILFQQLLIPKNVICTSIKNLLYESKKDIPKLKECIRYFLIKSTFGNRRNLNHSNHNDYFLSDLLYEIVKCNQIQLLEYILKKRDFLHIYFDYSPVILRCIEFDRIEMLKVLLEEHNVSFQNKKPIFITGNIIQNVVEKGSFKTFLWIVDNLLGKMINLNVYISCIITGLHRCKNITSSYFLFYIHNYLNRYSKEKINDALNFMYYTYDVPFYKKIYFDTN